MSVPQGSPAAAYDYNKRMMLRLVDLFKVQYDSASLIPSDPGVIQRDQACPEPRL